MTNREIVDKVESWNWNLSIFEIYDEVKDMGKYGYMGGQTSEGSDLSRLLNHAYEYFKYDKMIKELMRHLCVEVLGEEENKQIKESCEKQEKELDVAGWQQGDSFSLLAAS